MWREPLRSALVALLVGAVSATSHGSDPAEAAEQVRAHIEADRWREALAVARAAESLHPGDPESDTALGEALYRAGQIEEARTVLADVVVREVEPPPRAMTVLGLIHAAEGGYDRAVDLMSRAIEQAPDDAFVLYWGSGVQETRADAIATLEHYLSVAADDDPDRVEGVRGTLRLYRALGEDAVWVREAMPDRMELPLVPIRDGWGSLAGYRIDVHPGDRGKAVGVLFDTGSPALYLTEKVSKKRGIEPLAEETTFGGGGDGRHRSERGRFDRFRIGEANFRSALAYTTPRAVDPGKRFKGLIGVSPFRGYRVVIDLADHRLRLEPAPAEPEPGGVPYWTVSGQLLVGVEAVGGPTGLFLLDTGATRTMVDVAFARAVPGVVEGGATRVRGYGGIRKGVIRAEGLDLRFQGVGNAGRSVNLADMTYRSRLCGVQISGFLGLDVLDGARITVDTVHRRVYVEPAQRPR